MIIEVYIKGKFRAKYDGKSAGNNTVLSRNYQHIVFNEKWVEDAEEIVGYDKKLLTKEPYYVNPFLQDNYVSWKTGEKDVFFQEDFHDVVVNEIYVLRGASEKNEGELIGDFYGTLKVVKPDPPKENILPTKATTKTQPIVTNPKVGGDESSPIDDNIDAVFKKPWQPDDFLKNYGISRESWDGWKKRWEDNWLKLALYIGAMILMIKMGWLSAPIM